MIIWTAAHHFVWWQVIRLIAAAHFHVAPGQVEDIDYQPPHAAVTSWEYVTDVDDAECDFHPWGRYDVCIQP